MNRQSRYLLIGVALLLVVAAIVWSYIISQNDPLEDLADEMNAFGYSIEAEDFYVLGGAENTTIEAVVEDDLAAAIAASKAAGFPSNTGAMGEITILLAHLGNDDVLTVYLRDGETELCFIQTGEGEILPLGEE